MRQRSKQRDLHVICNGLYKNLIHVQRRKLFIQIQLMVVQVALSCPYLGCDNEL
jgi:hypothetical protein